MHCNGKCHLKKEIMAVQEDNTNDPNKPIPIPQNDKKTYPAILDNQIGEINIYLLKQIGRSYLLPFFKEIYIDIITPPPEIFVF